MRRSFGAVWGLGVVALLVGGGAVASRTGAAPAATRVGQEDAPFLVEPREGYPGDRFTVSDLGCPPIALYEGQISFNKTTVRTPLGMTSTFTVPAIPAGPMTIRFDCVIANSEVTPVSEVTEVTEPDASAALRRRRGEPGEVIFTVHDLPDLSAQAEPASAAVGETVTVGGVGCTTGHKVEVTLGRTIAGTVADRGAFAVDITVPDLAIGPHEIWLNCRGPRGWDGRIGIPFDVGDPTTTATTSSSTTSTTPDGSTTTDDPEGPGSTGPPDGGTTSPDDEDGPGAGNGGDGDDDDRTPPSTVPSDPGTEPAGTTAGSAAAEPGDRPAFVRALPTPGEVALDLPSIAADLALTALVVSVLIVGFPPEPFNTALERLEEHRRRRRQRQTRPRRRRPRLRRVLSHPAMLLPFSLVAAAVVAAAAPGAAADAATLRLFVGLAVAIAVTTVLVEAPGVLVARRRGGSGVVLRLHGAGIAVAVGLALLGHVVGLRPPYVYGLIASLAVVSTTTRPALREEAQVALTGAVLLLVVAIGSWFAWASVDEAVRAGAGPLALTVDATLAALVVTGFSSLLFGYLPFRYMDGLPLYRWRRGLWIALWAGAVFVALHVLSHDQTRHDLVGDAPPVGRWVTVALFAGFGILSLGFRAIVGRIVADDGHRAPGVVSPRIRLTRPH